MSPFIDELVAIQDLILFKALRNIASSGRAFVVHHPRQRLIDDFITGSADLKAQINVFVVRGRETFIKTSNAIEQSTTEDGAVARYLRQNLHRSPTTAPRLYEASRTEVAIARMAYFNIARTCLDFNSAALRSNMRRFLAHSLADTLAPEPSTNAELWRTLGQRALAEPMCYRKVFANGPGEKQIDDLFNAPNKQLEGFFKADLSTGEREYLEDFLEFMPKDNSIYGFTRNKLASLAHGLLGNWYYHNGDNRNAILEFDQALAGGTQCGEFHMRRGQALEALGDHIRGRADLQLAAQPSTRWCVTDPMSIVELQLAIKPLLEK